MSPTFKINPSKVRIIPFAPEDRFQILLEFPESEKCAPISFSVSLSDAMGLMSALQTLQAKYKIPIPPSLRPSGPPVLSVVTEEGPQP
jgi:hypothetical protein